MTRHLASAAVDDGSEMADRRGGTHHRTRFFCRQILRKSARMRARISFSGPAGPRMEVLNASEPDWRTPSDRCWALARGLGRTATQGRGPIGRPFATTRGGSRYLDPLTAAKLPSRPNGILPLSGLQIVSTRIAKKPTWEPSSRLIVVLSVEGEFSDEAGR